MNIDEMKAGREMDAMIAEKVMGWTDFDGESTMYWWVKNGYTDVCNGAPFACQKANTPIFSTGIFDAWQVVEQMRKNGFWFSVCFKTVVTNTPNYYVEFRCVRGGTRGTHCGNDDTIELAICRAALKAMWVEGTK